MVNEHVHLRTSYRGQIEMLNPHHVTANRSQSVASTAQDIALSLDGQTVYVVSYAVKPTGPLFTLMAWEVSSGKLRGETIIKGRITCLFPVGGGVLLKSSSGSLQVWRFDLPECIQRWTNLTGITEVIPISDEQVACVRKGGEVIVVDTSSGEILSTISTLHEHVVSCNSKLQIISIDEGVLQLSDGTAVLWEKELPFVGLMAPSVMFSPGEQFVVICQGDVFPVGSVHIIDAISGNPLHLFLGATCKFLTDDECVVCQLNGQVELYNFNSGHVLSVIDMEAGVTCLTTCPSQRLIAIGLEDSSPDFKIIQVRLPENKAKGELLVISMEVYIGTLSIVDVLRNVLSTGKRFSLPCTTLDNQTFELTGIANEILQT